MRSATALERQWPPALPPGYRAQPVRGFRDRTGRIGWELFRVYGRARDHDKHGSLVYQDDDLSYWCVTWPTSPDGERARLAGRSMRYAEYRQTGDSGLDFDRFFSLSPEELSALLPPGETGDL